MDTNTGIPQYFSVVKKQGQTGNFNIDFNMTYVEETKVVQNGRWERINTQPKSQTVVMPEANALNNNVVLQYVGEDTANYTNGYFYKNIATVITSVARAEQTVGSSLSDVSVNKTTFETQITSTGNYNFTFDGTDWSFGGNVVVLADYGITYSGTPVADDVITVIYQGEITQYNWTQISVQPDPKTYTGFDSTKTQVLKNIQGVLTWVDES